MYVLNTASVLQKISVNEIIDFIFKNYYKRVDFSKENSYYSIKHQEKRSTTALTQKILDPRNDKKHYQSFMRKKNTKSVKLSKIFTFQPNTFENTNIVDIKSVDKEHPKISHKL